MTCHTRLVGLVALVFSFSLLIAQDEFGEFEDEGFGEDFQNGKVKNFNDKVPTIF